MADLEWEARPERANLRRAIRHQLRRVEPTIRVVAENYLAEFSRIDLLAVGGEGEMISLRIAETQAQDDGDGALLTRALADLTWLRPRLGDFLKLAPGLGIEPSAEPRAIIFSARFDQETRAAVENFPSRSIELVSYHCFRQRGQLAVLFEAWSPPQTPHCETDRTAGAAGSAWDPDRSAALAGAPSRSSFRTGLTDADLQREVEEEKILD